MTYRVTGCVEGFCLRKIVAYDLKQAEEVAEDIKYNDDFDCGDMLKDECFEIFIDDYEYSQQKRFQFLVGFIVSGYYEKDFDADSEEEAAEKMLEYLQALNYGELNGIAFNSMDIISEKEEEYVWEEEGDGLKQVN